MGGDFTQPPNMLQIHEKWFCLFVLRSAASVFKIWDIEL